MRDIIFEKSVDTSWFNSPSYSELVDSMEYEVLFHEDIGSYQGDYLYFLKDEDRSSVLSDDARYGLLVFGYGSCSGCDSLQACSNETDVTDLRNNIHNNIKWFKSKQAVVKFINNKDTQPFKDWYWREDGADEFINKILEYCGGKKAVNGRKKKRSEED